MSPPEDDDSANFDYRECVNCDPFQRFDVHSQSNLHNVLIMPMKVDGRNYIARILFGYLVLIVLIRVVNVMRIVTFCRDGRI